MMINARLLLTAALVAAAAPAAAHPKLLGATPADAGAVAPTNKVTLRFSERIAPAFSGLAVSMVSMNGRAYPPAAMPVALVVPGRDGKSLSATLKEPLPPGGYRVDWYAVGADTHRVTGSLSFTVR